MKEGADSAAAAANVEAQLTELKNKCGLFARLKWVKVPSRAGKHLDGYQEFIRSRLETDGVYFKCMVIDTHKYPLGNAKRWAGDALVGYQKFYCVFLADGLMQRYPNYFYEIVVDEFAGVDHADLEYAVTGRYVKKVRPKPVMYYCEVKTGDDRNSNLLRLADLLVGLVWVRLERGHGARQSPCANPARDRQLDGSGTQDQTGKKDSLVCTEV